MAVSLNDLQQIKRTLKRAPPPRAPSGVSSAQNGVIATDTGTVSVASFRNKFEQKQTPSPKSPTGSSPCQDGGEPSEEGVISVASARALFEQKPLKKPPPPRKQVNGNQTKSGSSPCVDKNSNVNNLKREPTRKELPPFFRIGAAPYKPAKPDYLKSRLRRFQDKIVLANGTTTASRTTSKGRWKTRFPLFLNVDYTGLIYRTSLSSQWQTKNKTCLGEYLLTAWKCEKHSSEEKKSYWDSFDFSPSMFPVTFVEKIKR